MKEKVIKPDWVSIVMGCYNGAKYIDRSFPSILDQTYSKIQFIFVNDGSSDGSVQIAESYRSRFEAKGYEFLIISQENLGHGYACKTGIEIASGEFYGYLDVDDTITSDSIAKKVDLFSLHPECNIVKSNAIKVFESENNRKELLIKAASQFGGIEDAFEDYVMGKIDNYAGTYLVRANAINDFYKDKEFIGSRYGPNLQLLLPASFNSKQIFLNEPLMFYYMHDDSHSHKKTLSDSLDLLEGYNKIRTDVLGQFPEPLTELRRKQNIHFLSNTLNFITSYGVCREYSGYYNDYYSKFKSAGGSSVEFDMYHAMYNGERMKAFWNRFLLFLSKNKS